MIDHPMDLMPTEAADPRDVFSGSNNFGQGVTSNGTGLFDTTRSLFASSSSSSSQGDDPTTNRDYPPVRPTLASYPQTRKTGIVYDVRMMLHAPADYRQDEGHVVAAQNVSPDGGADDLTSEQEYQASHPEEPRRISRIYAKLKEANLVLQMVDLPCPEVTPEQVLLVHSLQLWQALESTFYLTDQEIERDRALYEHQSLYVNRQTALAARLSCGGVISACEAVLQGHVRNAIAVVRPPGHHAEPDQSMGFSFLNNVAVATKSVQKTLGVGKVLILDWDVHHGNGTQRAFFNDPNVLYISIHRHDGGTFYPASDFGSLNVTGEGAGEGKSVNIPWPTNGFGDADYLYAFQQIVMPIAYEFSPELVIISAGFDAADGDILGECKVTPSAYAHMTHMLMSLAGGKVVVALEGGYNLDAISNSAQAVARTLVGQELPVLGPMQASDLATETVYQVARVQSRYWKSINIKTCEPLGQEEVIKEDVVDIRDVLKAYRSKAMYEHHKLFVVPLASEMLEQTFAEQVMTDGKLYTAETVVLFVHDFGNLQVEQSNGLYVETDLVKSRLIESSHRVVNWTKSKGYSIIDVNTSLPYPTHRALLTGARNTWVTKQPLKAYVGLMKYIWDNYLELCDCKNIILLGYGTGCQAVVSLVNERHVQDKVGMVFQVGGMNSLVRPDPDNDDRRAWFRKHSKLYLPQGHPVLDDRILKKRLGTQIETLPGTTAHELLAAAMPLISNQVDQLGQGGDGESTSHGMLVDGMQRSGQGLNGMATVSA